MTYHLKLELSSDAPPRLEISGGSGDDDSLETLEEAIKMIVAWRGRQPAPTAPSASAPPPVPKEPEPAADR